jgi:hypothetical protein
MTWESWSHDLRLTEVHIAYLSTIDRVQTFTRLSRSFSEGGSTTTRPYLMVLCLSSTPSRKRGQDKPADQTPAVLKLTACD